LVRVCPVESQCVFGLLETCLSGCCPVFRALNRGSGGVLATAGQPDCTAGFCSFVPACPAGVAEAHLGRGERHFRLSVSGLIRGWCPGSTRHTFPDSTVRFGQCWRESGPSWRVIARRVRQSLFASVLLHVKAVRKPRRSPSGSGGVRWRRSVGIDWPKQTLGTDRNAMQAKPRCGTGYRWRQGQSEAGARDPFVAATHPPATPGTPAGTPPTPRHERDSGAESAIQPERSPPPAL